MSVPAGAIRAALAGLSVAVHRDDDDPSLLVFAVSSDTGTAAITVPAVHVEGFDRFSAAMITDELVDTAVDTAVDTLLHAASESLSEGHR